MREEAPDLEVEKWDKLKSWTKVQEEIEERLKNTEKYDDSMTLYYGPQLYHTFQNPVNIKCMTHFSSKVGEMFVSHYRLGKHDQLSVWSLSSMERGAKSDNQSFNINCEVKVFLFVPEHKVYMCFCSDLFMRIYSDAQSNCEEVTSLQCMTNVRCMAYNRETDDVYVGGIGILQKWKINGSEHSATAEPGPMFNTEIEKNEWVIDIQIDTRNNQLMAITYEGIFVINYMTMKQTHHLQNRHENSLRCCCFYKERDYFITGGGDGTIKVWNSVLFSQVHVFYGHHDVITGLQTHKINPLLFSSSLDGSVQIWRMDNFSKFMRLDLSEKIYSMKLIVDEEFYCQTENQIRIYSLNQFYSLFVPVESSVYKLQLCPGVKDQASRIIASTEDGSVRLFSPVTGATLTIIYPMPTFQVLSCFAYNREMNRLHSVLQNGEVLIFNCDTNPCKAVEMWIPETTDEEVLKIVQLTLGYMKNDTKVTDTVMLGGLRNGQICLLDASECVMIKNLQAHYGRITCMENATDIGETGFKLLETSQKMVTGGADQLIKIWNIGANSGKLYDNIVIQLLLQIPCPGTPEHISMYENTISVSTSDNSDKGKLHMYRMDGQESKEIQYTTLQHSQDEDHTEHITALDKCPLLGLFATASKDGYIKIWNRHNQLIREMGFGEPMHGLCFANTRGDILIGFQNHICSIPLTSYFPRNYLERITRQQFKDEYREPPIRHNNRIKASFDPKAIPQYSVSFSKRTEEKKPCEDEDILEDLEATPREPRSRVQEDSPEQEEENVEEDYIELAAVTLESPNQDKLSETKPKLKTKIKQKVRFREREKDTEVFKEEEDHLVERGYSAPGPIPSKKLKLEKMKGERRKSDTQYLEKISPYERDLMKRKLIIAPDGYIPNSVVRKRLGFVPPSTPVKKTDTWTIESEIRPFSWGDDKDSDEGGRKSSKNSPWKKMQPPLMRTSSTLSNLSTSSSRLGFTGTRKSTPTTPKYELKSKKFDLHRVDLDMGTPERMRRSVGTRSRERTKSFRLTNMVVDEQSTNVTFKEDSKLAHRKGLLPAAVDMDVIRRLLEEDFFPDLNGTASFDLIMQNLIRLLDTEDSELHAKICDYIMCIHRDIGIPDHYLDRIIGKLSLQLGGDNSSLKRFGLRTLKEIGADRQDVLAIILPRLMDAQDDIREEAKNVLAALSGVVNKEELLELINSMGLTKQFDSKDEQEEALKALAMRLDIPFRSDSFTDWINNWVDDSSSIYDSEPEVKLDDIEKAWDGRQRKWKQDSLCLTESASRASTRMRELSFLSKGSPTRDLSGLSGTLSGFDDYSTDFSQRDVESSPSDFPPKKKVQQAELTDIVQDYDPDYTKNLLMEDLLKEYSDVRESDLENENEMKIPEKSKRSDTYSKPDNGNDEVVKRIIEDKVVLNRCDSQDESDVGGSTEENGTAVKSSKGHDAVSRLVIDIDLDKRINSTDCGTPIPEVEENSSEEDLERKNTEGQLSGRSSGNSGNRPREKFDPRDSGLYKYYKNRYNREKEAEGKFNYKSMSKLFSRTQSGGADETDSQIGSLDSYSQIGDTLSINDSGITSIQDSGIGRDTSDSHGHTPYKASPRLIKEKIQTKPASYRSRIDSHRKHNLSPVKSSSTGTIRGMSIKSSPREKDPDWIKFFQTPTALERKRMEMVKKDYTEGKIKPGSAAVINYINEGLPMLPGELGLRLLKSVKVCGDKDLAPLSDRQHRIESIPGKLGVHTKSEDKGQSKYGILQMQWTTAVPVPVSHDTYPERYSSMSDATSTLGGSSIGTYSIERPLPSIVHKYANTERSSTTQFIDELDYRRLPGSVYSPDYEWDYPIPPPPAKESRISVPYIRKEHDRYCKYYTVVKKKMQNLASKKKASTLEQQLLPKVEIKKALPERLKLPRELTRLSRVPSVLYPPLTLHQLMSART